MTDKLTFSFQGAVKVRIGGTEVDLEKAAHQFQYDGRNSAKTDQLKGFEAGNGVFFRLKKHQDGKIDVIVYGPPDQLEKYQFKVKGGDLSRARFAQGEFRKPFEAREFTVAGRELGPTDLNQSMDRLGLTAHARDGSAVLHASLKGQPDLIHQQSQAQAADTMPRTGFENLGNTCYLNATLKTMMAGMGPSLVTDLKAQAGHHPFDFQVGTARPLDDIRQTLLALAGAACDPSQQPEVNRQLKALVAQLKDPALKQLADAADLQRIDLSKRLNSTKDQVVDAQEDLQLAKTALRLLEEGKPYKPVLGSLSKEAFEVKGYTTAEEFKAFLGKQSLTLRRREAAHQANLAQLAQEAQTAGYQSVDEQLRILTAASRANKFVGTLNSQQDATEFGSWLRSTMNLEPEIQRFTRRTELVDVWNEKRNGPIERGWSLPLNPRQRSDSLQTLLLREFEGAEVKLNSAGGNATKRLVLEANLGALTSFTVSIDGKDDFGRRVRLDALDLETPVKVPIVDTRSGATKQVVLRPREVIFHEGGDGGGHYFAYVRQGGDWFRHDDDSPVTVSPLPDLQKAQPRTIGFELVEIV